MAKINLEGPQYYTNSGTRATALLRLESERFLELINGEFSSTLGKAVFGCSFSCDIFTNCIANFRRANNLDHEQALAFMENLFKEFRKSYIELEKIIAEEKGDE